MHLKSAINLPLQNLKEQKYLILDEKDTKCFIYCSLDSRSIFASNFFAKQGFKITRIKGGLNAWINIIGSESL